MSVAALRAELAAVLPPASQPDDDTLEALLAVSGGSIRAARAMVLDSVGAEQRLSGQAGPAPTPATLERRRRPAAHASPPGRPRGGGAAPHPGPGGLAAALSRPWQLLQALLLFLSRWLPLRALLPSFFFPPPSRSGWIMGTADPALAAARYRERLQTFCDWGQFDPPAEQEQEQETEASGSTTAIGGSEQVPLTRRHAGPSREPKKNTGLAVPVSLLSMPYEQAVAKAKSEHRLLVISLDSGAKDAQAASFLRDTLLNPAWDALLQGHEVLLWAGDVSAGKEAGQVARILHASKYPFVAFVASQPRPLQGRVRLAVISRQQGDAVSLPLLTTQLEQVVLPRVTPFLTSLQDEERAKQMERQWRLEQEEAYAQAAQRDAERIAAKREEARLAEEQKREEEAKRQAQVQTKARYVAWRRWAAGVAEKGGHPQSDVYVQGTSVAAPGEKTEFVIRLPSGGRTTVHLSPEAKAEALFAAIELASPVPEEDEGDFTEHELALVKPEYKFALVTDYPRRIVRPTPDVLDLSLSSSGLLGQGAAPRRVALILEGEVGWESEESESESEEE